MGRRSRCTPRSTFSVAACPNEAQPLSTVQRGLRVLGLNPGIDAGGALSYQTVQAEINANRPIEIEADIPDGAPENVVRTVTENARTLKFTNQGFETE